MSQLVCDNKVSTSTGYDYLNEGIMVLAAQAPGLHSALLAAKAAGYDYVLLDGTLIETDRVSTPGPTLGVDLWWSKKHKDHGGNIQVLTAADGWPLWTSPVRRHRRRGPGHPPHRARTNHLKRPRRTVAGRYSEALSVYTVTPAPLCAMSSLARLAVADATELLNIAPRRG